MPIKGARCRPTWRYWQIPMEIDILLSVHYRLPACRYVDAQKTRSGSHSFNLRKIYILNALYTWSQYLPQTTDKQVAEAAASNLAKTLMDVEFSTGTDHLSSGRSLYLTLFLTGFWSFITIFLRRWVICMELFPAEWSLYVGQLNHQIWMTFTCSL